MAAVNGARLQKAQCPAVPITIDEIAADARECFIAGASSAHVHIRDDKGEHLLDAGIYRELLAEIKTRAPELIVQITTESAGKYNPQQQRKMARALGHSEVSAALREITADNDKQESARFYQWAAQSGVRIQHIFISPAEVRQLASYIAKDIIGGDDLFVLFVLGSYAGCAAQPQDIKPFLDAVRQTGLAARQMFCAFGRRENDCLLAAAMAGAECRIGFENNCHNANGKMAKNNAERVAELRHILRHSRDCGNPSPR